MVRPVKSMKSSCTRKNEQINQSTFIFIIHIFLHITKREIEDYLSNRFISEKFDVVLYILCFRHSICFFLKGFFPLSQLIYYCSQKPIYSLISCIPSSTIFPFYSNEFLYGQKSNKWKNYKKLIIPKKLKKIIAIATLVVVVAVDVVVQPSISLNFLYG